jgi:hypothetical protein
LYEFKSEFHEGAHPEIPPTVFPSIIALYTDTSTKLRVSSSLSRSDQKRSDKRPPPFHLVSVSLGLMSLGATLYGLSKTPQLQEGDYSGFDLNTLGGGMSLPIGFCRTYVARADSKQCATFRGQGPGIYWCRSLAELVATSSIARKCFYPPPVSESAKSFDEILDPAQNRIPSDP